MAPYERLLGDAMRGDQTLFAREDSVLEAWRVVEPVLGQATPLHEYERGTWGPAEADRAADERPGWHNPEQDWAWTDDVHRWLDESVQVCANTRRAARCGRGAGGRLTPRRRSPPEGASRWRCRAAPRRGSLRAAGPRAVARPHRLVARASALGRRTLRAARSIRTATTGWRARRSLDHVPIPPAHVHRMRGEDVPDRAADAYERMLARGCSARRRRRRRRRAYVSTWCCSGWAPTATRRRSSRRVRPA